MTTMNIDLMKHGLIPQHFIWMSIFQESYKCYTHKFSSILVCDFENASFKKIIFHDLTIFFS